MHARRVNKPGMLLLVLATLPFTMAPEEPEKLTIGGNGYEVGRCAWPYCGGLVIEERDALDAVVRQVVYAHGRPLWQLLSDGSSYYYHEDSRGNMVALTDGTGATGGVVERTTYDPHGVPRFQDAANQDKRDLLGILLARSDFGNTHLFGGHWYDPETGVAGGNANSHFGGLYSIGSRYYNPDEGRMTERPAVPLALNAYMRLGAETTSGCVFPLCGGDKPLVFGSSDGTPRRKKPGRLMYSPISQSAHHGHLDFLKQVGDPATYQEGGLNNRPHKLIGPTRHPVPVAIAIPNLLDARKSANESSAQGGLRTIANAQKENSVDDDDVPDFLDPDDDGDGMSEQGPGGHEVGHHLGLFPAPQSLPGGGDEALSTPCVCVWMPFPCGNNVCKELVCAGDCMVIRL